MKYTIIGDPHCKKNNLDQIEELFNIAESMGNPVVWLGDMLDTKDIIQGQCLNKYIELYSKSRLNHIILVGNHDLFNLMGTAHSLEPLKLLDNVNVIDKPYQESGITFVPYVYDGHTLLEWIEESDDSIFIGHLDIKGFDWGNGHYSTDGLDERDFNKFDLVISGHYHIRSERTNIKYIGTPFSHDHGTTNKQHYIAVLDSNAKELEWIATEFPQHRTHEINVDSEYTIELDSRDHNRIFLEGDLNKVKLAAELIKAKYPNVKVIQRISFEEESEPFFEAQDNVVSFKLWAETIKKLDPSTIDLGMKILKNED